MHDLPHDPEALALQHDPAVVQAADLDLPELADSYEEAEARLVADRYLRALGGVEGELGANRAELQQVLAFYRDRHEEREAVLQRRRDWLVHQLQALFAFLPLRGKAKSLTLLAGRLGTRTAPARYAIADEQELLAWAREHAPSLISTPPVKERVLVKDLTGWMDPLDPAPPGVERIDAHEEFFADPA